MQKIETKLKDCYILEPDVFGDDRGYFMEFYSANKMKALGLDHIMGPAIQGNRSLSKRGTLRGLHYQTKETAQTKLVECLQGSVLDVVVDLRKTSPTYKQWTSVLLTAQNHRQFLIPKGFAHGFLTLEDNTLFQYVVDYPYSPSTEGGCLWNDPQFGIDWGIDDMGEILLSDKDKNRAPYNEDEELF